MKDPDTLHQEPTLFGKEWADDYDIVEPFTSAEVQKQTERLAALAAGGPVLEVAAGTGRIAIPLAEKGLHVTATDASPELLAKLKANDRHSLVTSYLEVLPGIKGDAKYALICIMVNSIWWLSNEQDQRAFLETAARHLSKQGLLVVEMAVADPRRWTETKQINLEGIKLERSSSWSPARQRLLQSYRITKLGTRRSEVRDVVVRVLFPNELFLMAELAGLQLYEAWSDWDKKPFGKDSRQLIAIFKRARR